MSDCTCPLAPRHRWDCGIYAGLTPPGWPPNQTFEGDWTVDDPEPDVNGSPGYPDSRDETPADGTPAASVDDLPPGSRRAHDGGGD